MTLNIMTLQLANYETKLDTLSYWKAPSTLHIHVPSSSYTGTHPSTDIDIHVG